MSDAPTTLAVERTHLAWRRTALGLTAGGLTAAHLLQSYVGALAWSLAAIAILAAAVLAILSRRRHLTSGSAARPVDGRLVTSCAVGLLVLGAAALGYVVLGGA